MDGIYLETERLTLRRFTPADVDDLVALDGDPEVMRFLSGGPATPRKQIRARILPRFIAITARHSTLGYWAAHARENGTFLGWFAFHPIAGDAAAGGLIDNDDTTQVELGYRLRREAWGRGLATEGARALIDRGFRELGVRRVIATTYQYNVGSRRVLEKCGLTHIRSFRLPPADLPPADLAAEATHAGDASDTWDGDEVEYVLEQADWERRQEAGK